MRFEHTLYHNTSISFDNRQNLLPGFTSFYPMLFVELCKKLFEMCPYVSVCITVSGILLLLEHPNLCMGHNITTLERFLQKGCGSPLLFFPRSRYTRIRGEWEIGCVCMCENERNKNENRLRRRITRREVLSSSAFRKFVYLHMFRVYGFIVIVSF